MRQPINSIEQNSTDSCAETEEQLLCNKCGLCCNGNMFSYVLLVDEDFNSNASTNFEVVVEDGKRAFIQPCRYHVDNKCIIYAECRPVSCSKYICKILKRFKNKDLTFVQANVMIDTALSHAERVRNGIFHCVNNQRQGLFKLFSQYVSQSEPNPAVLVDYGAFEFRLKRDFGKNEEMQAAACDSAQDGRP